MTQKEIFKSENLEINIEDLENISGGMPGRVNFVRSNSGNRIATVKRGLSNNQKNLANVAIRAAKDGSVNAPNTNSAIFNGIYRHLFDISQNSSRR